MMKLIAIVIGLAAVAPSAHAKGCHEVSYVVGYEKCSRFGTWSRDQDIPALSFEWGWYHHDFMARPFVLPAEPLARSTSQEGTPLNTVVDGFAPRWIYHRGLVYTGLEMQIGGLTEQPTFAGLPASGVNIAGLGVAGVHASLWRLVGAAELAAGGRYTNYLYCATRDCTVYVGQGAGEVEARARVELFLASHWSVSFAYAHSLIDRDDHTFFVSTGVSLRAVDGVY